MTGYCPAGLPHSEIPGSKPVCGSPRLIAADRVLRRLSAPRHPPCTLSSLTKLEHSFPGESYRFLPNSVVNELCRGSLGSTLPSRRFQHRDRTVHSKNLRIDGKRTLVELIGFEPTTSALQGRRSPN